MYKQKPDITLSNGTAIKHRPMLSAGHPNGATDAYIEGERAMTEGEWLEYAAIVKSGGVDNRLTDDERFVLDHVTMFGSAAYPVRKLGRKWSWDRMRGVGGSPILYKTKREACAAFEVFYGLLLDKNAGRA